MNPFESAKSLYCGSLKSLMAHTIRAVENKFRGEGLCLDVVITPMPLGELHGALNTRLSGKTLQQASPVRVTATIYINEDSPKDLARFTIAHEIFHLLLELEQWTKERKSWQQILPTPQMEADCNRFAQALCYLHDKKLYRDIENLERNVYFCEELFQKEVTTDCDGKPDLPKKMALKTGVPYHQIEDPVIEVDVFPWLDGGS